MSAGLSYFNSEQQEEMRYLGSLTPAQKCWCGWYAAGACNTPNPCPPDSTMAQREVVTCECGGYPGKPGATTYHRKGCQFGGDK